MSETDHDPVVRTASVKITDVAAAAGVAPSTVRRFINAKYRVKPELAARVRDAIARLGYVPNLIASGLSSRKSGVTGDLAEAKQVGNAGIGQTLGAVAARWNIPGNQASTIIGSEKAGFFAALASGQASLETRDMRDRARIFFDIYEGVYSMLRDPLAERGWIRAPRPELEGQSVLDLMTEGSQRNLIRALGFIDYVNGR